jgi:glutamyl-tRNA reductase
MVDPQPRVVAWVAAAPSADVDRRAMVLPRARAAAASQPAILLETCHRVELYADETIGSIAAPLVAAGMARLDGVAAIRRIVAVAIGLESAVLGEDQLLHQLRGATAVARRGPRLGRDLDRTIDHALRAGRIARSWRPVDGVGRSLGDATAQLAARSLGPLAGRRVLVVGAGSMGEATVTALVTRGASVALASPTAAHADEVAARHGIDLWPIDPGRRLATVDLVVVALAGPWQLSPASLDRLGARPLVVDLSMPPALPAAVAIELGGRHLGIDALARPTIDRTPLGDRYRARLEGLAERTVATVIADLAATGPAEAAALADQVERQRRLAVEAYLRERPGLDDAARDEIEAATRDLAARLFRVPLARLADDPRGARRRAVEELFG